jgi:quinoprotein glucose dehydrogenase
MYNRVLFFATILLIAFCSCNTNTSYNTWKMYGGNGDNNHYSALSQVDTNNVTQLKVAWIYHTGDVDAANHSQIQCNPIIIDGVLYGTSPLMRLFAIDATTGKQKWILHR